MTAKEYFLRYVAMDTTSDEASDTYPSTSGQVELLSLLQKELLGLGVEVAFDGKYVIGTLPKVDSGVTLALIAHVDTSPAVSGKNVKVVRTLYGGGDLALPHAVISAADLKGLEGQYVLSSDGSTLLGADDKAGVAEIMATVAYFMQNKNARRCNLKVVFTPDEEVGNGTKYLQSEAIAADYGYTVDGGAIGEIEYENFNAAALKLTVNGKSIHPGSAKNVMKNAIDLFCEFHARLPWQERPVNTEGYEGFYMASDVEGGVDKLTASYIIRDHDKEKFEQKKTYVTAVARELNALYGENTFVAELKDSYYNMKEIVAKHPHLIEYAKQAFLSCGVQPKVIPIRGGTDGATLSYKGLPCPNLSTGGFHFHAKTEFIPERSMEDMVAVLKALVVSYADFKE